MKFARTMGFSESCVPSAADTMMKLYQIFIERDALLIEINPMAEDSLGRGRVDFRTMVTLASH
jgi:succinyl-CoA synthetase beta subunit